MKIQVIAESVGYSTDVSFRRAFKRVTGMSPSEYRGDGTEGA
jgi:AraC-like DNA-binding protein